MLDERVRAPAITAPNTAENVCRGTPSQSAQDPVLARLVDVEKHGLYPRRRILAAAPHRRG